jgi:hypothetical protein
MCQSAQSLRGLRTVPLGHWIGAIRTYLLGFEGLARVLRGERGVRSCGVGTIQLVRRGSCESMRDH